jgi:hypothetical protein
MNAEGKISELERSVAVADGFPLEAAGGVSDAYRGTRNSGTLLVANHPTNGRRALSPRAGRRK